MPSKPLLSIIIVNYNTADITVNCLRSIYQDKGLKDIPFEIILVDNASTDKSILKIKNFIHSIKIKNFKLKINQTNIGFGAANNQGLKKAQGQYILMLNTDTIILHSAISQSLNWLSSHPEAGGCTAQLLNKDRSIQPSGGYFPTLLNMCTLMLHLDDLPFVNAIIKPYHPHTPNFYTHDKYFTTDHSQDWLTGAYILIRQEIINKVNGFSPEFFMYGEEMEMCYRIHQTYPQLQFWYLIGPQVIHLGGASSPSKQLVFDREYIGIQKFFQIHKSLIQQKIVNILISINRFLQSILKHA
ncbi:MAG: glycosyltransferase family 2 protein [Candidatus Shapirobacteria bacterium]